MSLPSARRALFGACAVAAILAACADEALQPSPRNDAASAGGPSSGGFSGSIGTAGSGGTGGSSGTGGSPDASPTDASIDASTDGAPESGATDATADHIPIDADSGALAKLTLFSVAPGARGLPGSAISQATTPAGSLFSAPSSPECRECHAPANQPGPPLEQPTVLEVTPDALGLSAGDDVDALSTLTAAPLAPLYFFSLAPGSTPALATEASRSVTEGKAAADVFSSRGQEALGSNSLVADRIQLGLALGEGDAGASADNVDALVVAALGAPSRVYFSVAAGAMGEPGSALNATPANERACTVFQSSLDGAHSLAFDCASLGLAPGDDVSALAVIGETTATRVLFSVTGDSLGSTGSAVETERLGSTGHAADIFASVGTGTNTLVADAATLGLAPVPGASDLDALDVADVEPSPTFSPAAQCEIPRTLNPAALPVFALAPGGLLVEFADSPLEVKTYDLEASCAEMPGSKTFGDVLSGPVVAAAVRPTAFPISQTDPLSSFELWVVTNDAGTATLVRLGGPTFPIAGLAAAGVRNLVHHSGTDVFELAHAVSPSQHAVSIFPRPTASTSSIGSSDQQIRPIPFPCSAWPTIVGVDPASGGLEYADPTDPAKRICSITREGHQRRPPGRWELAGNPDLGFIETFSGTLYALTLETASNRIVVNKLAAF